MLPRKRWRQFFFIILVNTRDRCLLGEQNRRRPFRPGHAPPRCDPPVVRPSFGLGRFFVKLFRVPPTNKQSLVRDRKKKGQPCSLNRDLSSPKLGHTTSGSGRGGAWPDRKGRRRFGSPKDICPSFPPGAEDNCPERLFGSTNSLSRT